MIDIFRYGTIAAGILPSWQILGPRGATLDAIELTELQWLANNRGVGIPQSRFGAACVIERLFFGARAVSVS